MDVFLDCLGALYFAGVAALLIACARAPSRNFERRFADISKLPWHSGE
jgi:hypothetical protein